VDSEWIVGDRVTGPLLKGIDVTFTVIGGKERFIFCVVE